MEFTYSINSQPVDAALQNFQAALADNSPALGEVSDDLREMIAEQFATEGRAGGTPWAPLAPSTLRGSLVEAGAPGHVEELDAQSLLFGSSLPYAIFHQTGTGIGFGQMKFPARSSSRKGRKSATAGKFSGSAQVGRGRALPMRPLIVLTEARAERWTEMVRSGIEAKTHLLGSKELG